MTLIPFSLLPPALLRSLSAHFMSIGKLLEKAMPQLQIDLERIDMQIDSPRYLAMCFTATLLQFVFIAILLSVAWSVVAGIILAALLSSFVFFMQIKYPSVKAYKRVRKIDADVLGALRAIMIQLDAGVPLFDAMVIVSRQNFGEVSKEFHKVVKQMSGGVSQIQALEEMALKNPSPYFRRGIWQIMNGMKQGADINPVIQSVVSDLSKEQIIQIEKYGAQLSPLAMFYMMGAVILPALGTTFIIILSGFLGLEDSLIKLVLWGLLGFIVFFQLMFSGTIKTRRPSLLGE
ncbi:type II secretion system F family protein [Candidatus Woesearchaeota archaeon]|nr:type II secretion system F family protein [Candidatus Woesearchaeota archaeon]